MLVVVRWAVPLLVVCLMLGGCTNAASDFRPAQPGGDVRLGNCPGGWVGSSPNDARSALFGGSPREFADRFLAEFDDVVIVEASNDNQAPGAVVRKATFDSEHGRLQVEVDGEGLPVAADYGRNSAWGHERDEEFAWLVERLTHLGFESPFSLRADDNDSGFVLHQEVDGRDIHFTGGHISHGSDGGVGLSVRHLRHVEPTEFMEVAEAQRLAAAVLGCTLERDGYAEYQVKVLRELEHPGEEWAEEEVWGIDGRLAYRVTAAVGSCGDLQRTVFLDAELGGVLRISDSVLGCAYLAGE